MGLSVLESADGSVLKDADGNILYVDVPSLDGARTVKVPRETRQMKVVKGMSHSEPVKVLTKYAAEVLDYPVDWSDELGLYDYITSSVFAVESGDVTIDQQTRGASNTVVWISTGTAGTVCDISNTIQTGQGRTEKRIFRIIVV